MGKGQDENLDKSEEVTMWYKPTECELHKWIKVAKSSLPKCENDVTEGYGVFAERNFKEGDYISIYLGKYVDEDTNSIYSMQQNNGEKGSKIIATDSGFPS